MDSPRASGILLHPTSLPSRFGIGDFGPEAYAFADFLSRSGQSLWQMLPLGPTDHGNSPYACYSAFAGNTLLISPDLLVEGGLLTKDDLSSNSSFNEDKIDFGNVRVSKEALLLKAYARHQASSDGPLEVELEKFSNDNEYWLEDYALFRALKTANNGGSWHEWEPSLAELEPSSIAHVREELGEQIQAEKFFQFLFFKQWQALKKYCNEHEIKLIGDIPIFVAHDSADVWTNAKQFKLQSENLPAVVAGVPPDYFSASGQFWGNPIYNWERMAEDGFKWWTTRMRAAFQMYDTVRLDHFRGFAACWEIPAGSKTAEKGSWVEAPGKQLFTAMRGALGDLPIIAEDLGVITPDVDRLRDEFGFPGMRVLQFAFGSGSENIHLPHNYCSNLVAYTGTHDNNTAVGWFNETAGEERTENEIQSERDYCKRYLNTDGNEIHWEFIRTVLASVANTAIIPLQDVLGLGSDARMNLPNTVEGNWKWRVKASALTDEIATRLESLTETYGRKTGYAEIG